DEVVHEDVGREVDRCRRIAEIVEELQDPGLRSHRKRDVDRVDPVRLDPSAELCEPAGERYAAGVADALRRAVVEVRDHARTIDVLAVDDAGQALADLVGSDDDAALDAL